MDDELPERVDGEQQREIYERVRMLQWMMSFPKGELRYWRRMVSRTELLGQGEDALDAAHRKFPQGDRIHSQKGHSHLRDVG